MAKIKIDKHGVTTITMNNGAVLPVPAYVGISMASGACPEVITFADEGEWWITDYRLGLIDGLAGDLADGETFTSHDGVTWTRYGDEMLVVTPARQLKAAA